jgi:hypothetical protein
LNNLKKNNSLSFASDAARRRQKYKEKGVKTEQQGRNVLNKVYVPILNHIVHGSQDAYFALYEKYKYSGNLISRHARQILSLPLDSPQKWDRF